MKKKLLLSLLVLGFPLLVIAQDTNTTTKAAGQALPVKKVSFNASNAKSPFISKEEAYQIELKKKEEEEAAKQALIKAQEEWKKKQAEILRKKILCDETKRHPARAVEKSIHLDGIIGANAIINGITMTKGSKFVVPVKLAPDLEGCDFNFNPDKFKIKLVSVTENSVWLVYKGERFEVKLPLL